MSETIASSPPFVLLVAVDASPHADAVVAYAAALARGKAGAVLHVVHVVAPSTDVTTTPLVAAYTETMAGQRDFLDARARAAQAASGVNVVGHLREGDPGKVIVQTAANIDADLVVLGTHDRHGVKRLVMGSVAEHVMRHAACPVLVVREKAHHASKGPEIEPPCADCVRAQQATGGASLWCARHAEHHPRAHLHYASDDGFATTSNLVHP